MQQNSGLSLTQINCCAPIRRLGQDYRTQYALHYVLEFLRIGRATMAKTITGSCWRSRLRAS